MRSVLDQLQQLDRETFAFSRRLEQPENRSNGLSQLLQYQQQLETLQPQVVAYLSNDQVSAATSRQVSDLYVELERRFEGLSQKLKNNMRAPVSEAGLAPPRVSAVNSTMLNQNIQSLKDRLKEVQLAINQTQDVAEPTFEQLQHEQELQEASALAVQTVRSTTQVQNRQLNAELSQIRAQLQELVEENSVFREQNAKLRQEIDGLTMENNKNAQNAQRLFVEREATKEDFEHLVSERERYNAKFQNAKQLYEFESNRNATFRQEQLQKLAQIEEEKKALAENNEKMADRIRAMEQCDMEAAAIEVQRATKTVAQLTTQIEDLKKRLVEQRASEQDSIEELKATLIALNEGKFEESIVRSQLGKQLDDTRRQNQALEQRLSESRIAKSGMLGSFSQASKGAKK